MVGFSDKLRFMAVLNDDMRVFKEYPIRNCRECCFSNGGHLFAAVHGNTIQIFNTWTFENIGNLKGHNGKVKSLYWGKDDTKLISCGTDGAVYGWSLESMKRDNENILKGCSYSSAVCTPSSQVIYAVGSDKMIKVDTFVVLFVNDCLL
jgi:WD40 repeat protein